MISIVEAVKILDDGKSLPRLLGFEVFKKRGESIYPMIEMIRDYSWDLCAKSARDDALYWLREWSVDDGDLMVELVFADKAE